MESESSFALRPRTERVVVGEWAGVRGEMLVLDLWEALWPLGVVTEVTAADCIGT
jgi:hypothetical protein